MLGLLGAGLILLGVSRPWGTVTVDNLASFGDIEISGSQAAPAGTAVALAVAAASLVLTIAGRVFRFVIPVGVLIAGVALGYSGVATLNEPAEAASDAVRDTLNLEGNFIDGFTASSELNSWGWIYVVGAAVIALAGLLGVLGSRSWPVTGRRFEREDGKKAPKDVSRPAVGGWSSSADVWDAQNRGEDLTSDLSGADRSSGDDGSSGGSADTGSSGGSSDSGSSDSGSSSSGSSGGGSD
nr:Trp biosynthesis-associated membrane protein [Kineosporia babensis]